MEALIIKALYLILALLALGVTIFLHELGHYWMAIRTGMTVEVFSVGFGKPLFVWERKGVKWQICLIPLGGYVRILGLDDQTQDRFQKGSFYSASAWSRLKVVAMGPIVNLLLAFAIFSFIWVMGGRDKSLSEVTTVIGWVDEKSDLYKGGVRPGDRVIDYDGRSVRNPKDHLIAAMLGGETVSVTAQSSRFMSKSPAPLNLSIDAKPYSHPFASDPEMKTLGVLSPARSLIFDGVMDSVNWEKYPSNVNEVSIQKGDRLIWMGGERVFSNLGLQNLMKNKKVLLTIKRGNSYFMRSVPLLPTIEYALDESQRQEMNDWRYESGLKHKDDFKFIPYDMSSTGEIQKPYRFIDPEMSQKVFPPKNLNINDKMLKPGDEVMAVNGVKVSSAHDFVKELENPRTVMIFKRNQKPLGTMNSDEVDESYLSAYESKDLSLLIEKVGLEEGVVQQGDYILIPGVSLIKGSDALKSYLDKMSAEERHTHRTWIKELDEEYMIGARFTDDRVKYNVLPQNMFLKVLKDSWGSINALVSGNLSPKWFSGPVGFMAVMYQGWSVSYLEALYWVGLISLYLGVTNLLPLPVLDGGYIVFNLIELITRKKLDPKIMDRMIVPFMFLLLGLTIFVTYWDVSRVFGGFFK